jgi:putative NADPH-quinone reductase
VEIVRLADLHIDFMRDPRSFKSHGDQEPDLVRVRGLIAGAKHLVWVYPNWWGTMPALLKGFIDRTLVTGFAFRYRGESGMVDGLLQGKTSRMLVSMDGPSWWYRLAMGAGGDRAMLHSTLRFCGIHPLRPWHAHSLRGLGKKAPEYWIDRARDLGRRDGRLLARI